MDDLWSPLCLLFTSKNVCFFNIHWITIVTISSIINGEFRQYKGTRDKNSFMSFIEDKKWQTVEPVPSWKSPDSIQMSVVSSFFKLSQVLRVSI